MTKITTDEMTDARAIALLEHCICIAEDDAHAEHPEAREAIAHIAARLASTSPAPDAAEVFVSLDAIDAAFEQEIQRVSTLEYNAHETCEYFYQKLRERIAAPAAAEGWVMVPREPTEAMLVAGEKAMFDNGANGTDLGDAKQCFRAMLSAAPQPVVEKENERDGHGRMGRES